MAVLDFKIIYIYIYFHYWKHNSDVSPDNVCVLKNSQAESGTAWLFGVGPIGCPETLVT